MVTCKNYSILNRKMRTVEVRIFNTRLRKYIILFRVLYFKYKKKIMTIIHDLSLAFSVKEKERNIEHKIT